MDRKIAQITAAVQSHRLVTLCAPGGGGKTRIAVQVAQALSQADAADPPDGAGFDRVCFVALAGCTSRDEMADAIVLALGCEGGRDELAADRVEAALAGRRSLLVLDNFEQLVDGARDDVARLVARLPRLHLLVTSRRALKVDGEREIALPALPLPAADAGVAALALNPAVALFIDRGQAVREDFRLEADNRAAVAGIVRRLDGLPLAIELAAARLRSMAPADMLALLDCAASRGSDEALRWLSRAGDRAAHDARHASMLQVVAWSHDLLGADARRLLLRLSVFHDGAPATAIEPGLGPLLDELVGSSVLRADTGADGTTRYRPLEPVREFMLSRTDAAGLTELHARHRSALLRWAGSQPRSPSLARFRAEIPNLLAAFASALDDGEAVAAAALALACASALDEVTLPTGALLLLERVASASPDARLLALLAEQCFESGRGEAGLAHALAALDRLPGDAQTRAEVMRTAARLLIRVRNDHGAAQALLDRALPLARDAGQPDTEARLLSLQAIVATRRDQDHGRAELLHRAALARWEAEDLPLRATAGRVNLALCLGLQRRVSEQLALLEPALAAAEAQAQWRLLVFARSVQGYALADLRRWPESAAAYRACLHAGWAASAASAWREWFYGLWNLPRTLAHLRRPEAAMQLLAFAERFHAERFGQLGRVDLREQRRTRRLVEAQLGVEVGARLAEAGRRLDVAGAMRLAMDDAPPQPTTRR